MEAYPPPQVYWTKDGATIKGDKIITMRQEHEIRQNIQPVFSFRHTTKHPNTSTALIHLNNQHRTYDRATASTGQSAPVNHHQIRVSTERNMIPSGGLDAIVHHTGTINTKCLSQLTELCLSNGCQIKLKFEGHVFTFLPTHIKYLSEISTTGMMIGRNNPC